MAPRLFVPPAHRRLAAAILLAAIATWTAAGCDDGDDDAPRRTCGDGLCDSDYCESPVRCPNDCGACVGSECPTGGTMGSCLEPCASSCDCVNTSEFCSADYGVSPGSCLPVTCLDCLHSCNATPDADGLCATATCP